MPSICLKTEIPGPRSRELNKVRHAHVSPGPFHTTPVIASHAKGSVVTDVDGNSFLDFSSGIGVTNLGHRDESVMQAVAEQAEKFVQLFKRKKQKLNVTKDTNIIALELSISNKIGLNVNIQNNKRNKGKISFEYKDLDQLNKIIEIIKSNY